MVVKAGIKQIYVILSLSIINNEELSSTLLNFDRHCSTLLNFARFYSTLLDFTQLHHSVQPTTTNRARPEDAAAKCKAVSTYIKNIIRKKLDSHF